MLASMRHFSILKGPNGESGCKAHPWHNQFGAHLVNQRTQKLAFTGPKPSKTKRKPPPSPGLLNRDMGQGSLKQDRDSILEMPRCYRTDVLLVRRLERKSKGCSAKPPCCGGNSGIGTGKVVGIIATDAHKGANVQNQH